MSKMREIQSKSEDQTEVYATFKSSPNSRVSPKIYDSEPAFLLLPSPDLDRDRP